MIGAGGIKMANYLYAIAPQDGTAIGMFPNTLVAAQAVGTEGVQYDANRFSWLGSITTSPVTLAVWHAAGVQSIEDARKREIVVAASNKGAITYTFPRMLNEFLGTRFKIVSGYQGNGTMTIAMERGEVEGVTNSWDSWKSFNPAWVEEKKIKVLVQTEPKAKDLAVFPRCRSSPATTSDRQIMALIVSGDALGKPVATSPNVPAERVQALRDAFDATIKDPGFIEAAAAAQDGDQSDRRPRAAGHGGESPRHAEEPRRARQGHHRRVEPKPLAGDILTMPYQPASRALQDLVVLDLTHARAGPVCVRQLADWGANVIRIERPGDPADIAGRHEADFQNKHRNKRGMALNLREPTKGARSSIGWSSRPTCWSRTSAPT